jgi:predicted acyltransferase
MYRDILPDPVASVIYQYLLDQFFLPVIIKSVHNGLAGSLSWAGLLLLGTVFADLFHAFSTFSRRTWLLVLGGILTGGVGLLLSLWFPIAKNRVSVSYIMVSLGFCLLSFAVFHVVLSLKPGWLCWIQRIGQNPLGLYIAHLLLLGLVVAPGIDTWYAGAPIWLSLIQAAAIFAAIIWLSVFFEKKHLILRL